jgi:dinuclear metal center YbgI/SA1388 family protein
MTHAAVSSASAVARELDVLLRVADIPDYPPALNGVQLENRSPLRKVAAAVDFSRRAIEGAIAADANLLLVHHGMFWGGLQPLSGATYERLRLLIDHDVAVYASHLPLDAHPILGNNVLLARELGLQPSGGFARYKTIDIGVRGEADISTADLADRARTFAKRHGGEVIVAGAAPGRMTQRWGICTGAGASAESLAEAEKSGIDTLIVGEGPHWTATSAEDSGLAIIYAGHYATETLGVAALAQHVADVHKVGWTFIDAPTGL